MRRRICLGKGQDLEDISWNPPVAEQHSDLVPDLGVDQPRIGNVPVHIDVSGIEDLRDRRARHQRLADMRETRRDNPGNWRSEPALSELSPDLINAALELSNVIVE